MKEILFRGKRVDGGEWVEGFYCRIQNDDCSYSHYIMLDTTRHISNVTQTIFEVIPETVSQYIGITDQIGANIFEGDIVVIDTEDGHKAYLVCFAESEDEDIFISGFMGKYLFDAPDCDNDDKPYFLVIGNIHDNTELYTEDTENVK